MNARVKLLASKQLAAERGKERSNERSTERRTERSTERGGARRTLLAGEPDAAASAGGASDHPAVLPERRLAPRAFEGSSAEIIKIMRNGMPARKVAGIASNLGLTQDRLFELLRLPKSTIKGRISNDGMLSAIEQDRIYRAENVLARAHAVLEDEDAARVWLSRENRALGGEAPLALLDTEVGYELVLDTLGRIEAGIVS